MKHHHTWKVVGYTLLELPTARFADRVMLWTCLTCPRYAEVSGHILIGAPIETPEFWDKAEAEAKRREALHHA